MIVSHAQELAPADRWGLVVPLSPDGVPLRARDRRGAVAASRDRAGLALCALFGAVAGVLATCLM